MMTPEKQRSVILSLVERLQKAGFYGKLILQFREGNWTMAWSEQTALPEKIASDGVSILRVQGD